MLREILSLYTAARAEGVRTPVPHLFGPPGCGKSTFVEQAAEMLGVQLHSINVSRISPLELEGVQMPTEGKLEMYLATYWNKLKDGDILFLDEFLRGFPEVYNGLLDILTSRTVAGHKLPDVFIIAASNSVVAYDAALTDRLLHLPVPDPRHNKMVNEDIAKVIVKELDLVPGTESSQPMDVLLQEVVHPMYAILDSLKGNSVGSGIIPAGAQSPRNLVGQAKLRYVTERRLAEVLDWSNATAMSANKPQYFHVYTYKGKLCNVPTSYVGKVEAILSSPKLTDQQRQRVQLNLQFIATDRAMKEATP